MIVGVAVVRNEDDLIATTIRHHLGLGLDAILISDNESTDDTLKIIQAMAATDARIHVRQSIGFDQQRVVNALAGEARQLGADWILPFDADEFWWGEVALAELLPAAPREATAVQARVMNFVQHRDQLHREPKAPLRAIYRPARLIGSPAEAPLNVASGAASFVETTYAPKSIFRASAGGTIGPGGHGFIGPTIYAITDQLLCLHLPIRSLDILGEKVAQSHRLDAAGMPSSHGWQQRHFAKQAIAGELEAEWAANSADDAGTLAAVRGPVKLVVDRTLADVVAPYLP